MENKTTKPNEHDEAGAKPFGPYPTPTPGRHEDVGARGLGATRSREKQRCHYHPNGISLNHPQ